MRYMQHLLRVLLVTLMAMPLALGGALAAEEKLTTPEESLDGLRPGTVTLQHLNSTYGMPQISTDGGLLGLYGGAEDSHTYGWYMIENPSYVIPDLAVETAKGSDRIDLVMAIGYAGFRTEKGIRCFSSEEELISAYGPPTYAYALPVNGRVIHELYYPDLGISFDLAQTGITPSQEVIAIYVTYPEFLLEAIDIRKGYIDEGTGREVTPLYRGAREV